jgi:hypothetical protein
VNCLFHGAPITSIMQWLGHTHIVTTAAYLRVFTPDTDEFMDWVRFD